MNNSKSDNREILLPHIMHLLQMMPYDLQFGDKLQKLNLITDYFADRSIEDVSYHISKILEKRRPEIVKGYSALDIMLEYTNLKRQEEALIAGLPQEEFAPDIVEELSNKFLTQKAMARAKEDLAKRQEENKIAELEGVLYEREKTQVLDKISSDLQQIEQLKQQLEHYN